MRRSRLLTISSIALFTVLGSESATAQLQPQAYYPLRTNLTDAGPNSNGPVTLLGTPAPAAPNEGVCINGVYRYGGQANWQDIQTPDIATLDQNDFQLNIEFQIAAMPTSTLGGPVIMGGNGWRWIGIYLLNTGVVGIKHNNSIRVWSTTTLTTGTWYTAELKYEAGTVELYIDGVQVLQSAIGPLSTNNDFDFMPTDYSNCGVFTGCIRNLMISNDTTLGVPTIAPYGSGCGPTTGGPAPAIGALEIPLLGNANFGITLADGPATAPAFLALGSGRTSIQIGAGCTQLLAVGFDTVTFAITDPVGALTIPIPVPNNPVLAGQFGYFQWVTADPNGPVRGAFTLSNAIAVQVN